MAEQYFVGVDIGTTGSKALIVDAAGTIAGTAYQEYDCNHPRPGWVEQDVTTLVDASMEVTRLAMASAGIDPALVSGVSFSTQRCCTIFLDSDDELTRPMISWQDNRPIEQVQQIRDQIGEARFFEITRFPLSTTWMLPKILWLQQNEPDAYAATAKIVQLQDYTLKAWGAEGWMSDRSDGAFWGMWDTAKLDWSDELLTLAKLDKSMLPEIKPSGAAAGTIPADIAARTGLLEGTPLFVGAGDQNAAAFGAGLVSPGMVSVSLGTAGLLAAYTDQPILDPTGKNMMTNHVADGAWMVEGYQASAGSVYRWFRDEIAALESAFAREMKRDVYAILDTRIAKVPPGAKGLVMLPHFGTATTPRWDPNARGVICGLAFSHDRDCLARAFMESITLSVQDMLVAMRAGGVTVNEVHILGGPTKSKLWNQMQADIYNCPVRTLKNTEAAVLGAAMIVAVGNGTFDSIPAAAAAMVQTDETYTPNPDAAKTYETLYGLFDKLHTTLAEGGVFDAIAQFQADQANA